MVTTCTASQLSGKTNRRWRGVTGAGDIAVCVGRHSTAYQRVVFVQRSAMFPSPLPSCSARRASGVRTFGARSSTVDGAGAAEPEDKSGMTPGRVLSLEDAQTRVMWLCCGFSL